MTKVQPTLIPDVREQCIKWAYYLLKNKARCTYTENLNLRWGWKDQPIGHLPFFGDCDATVDAICYWAGAQDPNGLDFNPGNTASMFAHAQRNNLVIVQSKMLVADFTLFGWTNPTTPQHVAMALQPGTVKNPSYFSMGQEGDPSIVTLKELLSIGDAIFVRNVTKNRHLAA